MKWWLLIVMSSATVAWADIPPDEPPTPPDLSCVGKTAGAACADGGRCVSRIVRRPDFSSTPPTWRQVQVLTCEGKRVTARPFIAVLLMLGTLFFLGRRRVLGRAA